MLGWQAHSNIKRSQIANTVIQGDDKKMAQQQSVLNETLFFTALQTTIDEYLRSIEGEANVIEHIATHIYGWTPLHRAAREGRLDACRLLVDEGANVNATNVDDWSPLHLAAQMGHVDVCRALIRAGANVNATNNDDRTPLDLVIQYEQTEALAYFYVHQVVNFHVAGHTGMRPWDRLTGDQRKALAKAMEDHKEKEVILQSNGLPNELARLVMGYL